MESHNSKEVSTGTTELETNVTRGKKKARTNQPSDVVQFEEDVSQAGISAFAFAQARAMEMKAMLKAVDSQGGTKRVFQKLPRHMRRRAMSYNVKRLPRRLRKEAHAEMLQSDQPKTKRPSRRKRRYPRNLMEEYKKRSDKSTWLETHVWHAKRMKMISKWGYKLALRDTGKGVRATYRSLNTSCIMTDLSYYHCIEITGVELTILSIMNLFTNPATGLTCAAKSYLSGQHQGRVMLYRPNQYPFGCLGPVEIMWDPLYEKEPSSEEGIDPGRILWLWVHPSMSDDVNCELTTVCSDTAVSVKLRKDEFTHLRLFGPKALDVITDMLSEAKLGVNSDGDSEQRERYLRLLEKHTKKSRVDIVNDIQWWKRFDASDIRYFTSGRNSLNDLRSSHVPRGAVIGVVARDPRSITPSQRTSASSGWQNAGISEGDVGNVPSLGVSDGDSATTDDDDQTDVLSDDDRHNDDNRRDNGDESDENSRRDEGSRQDDGDEQDNVDQLADSDQGDEGSRRDDEEHEHTSPHTPSTLGPITIYSVDKLTHSPMWNAKVRQSVSLAKVPDHVINETRSGRLVRCKVLDVGDVECLIPVLLVHQDHQTSLSGSSSRSLLGWDIISPRGWSMSLLVNCVYRCARVAGLEEQQRVAFESTCLHFPTDYPDCRAASSEVAEEKRNLEQLYSKHPPAKRPNYGKLAVQSPFDYPWEQLFSVEAKLSEDSNGFYVLRSVVHLKALRALFSQPQSLQTAELNSLQSDELQLALVAVEVTPIRGGCPERHSMLCVPTGSDLREYNQNSRYTGPEEDIVPRGTCVGDKEHVYIGKSTLSKKLLKLAKKKWKKGIKKTRHATDAEGSKLVPTSVDACVSLQLEPVVPSRSIIGYVTTGGYQHSSGCGFGFGFCPLPTLVQLVELCNVHGTQHPVLLVRNPTSRMYNFARISIH